MKIYNNFMFWIKKLSTDEKRKVKMIFIIMNIIFLGIALYTIAEQYYK